MSTINTEALSATIHTLQLTQETVPARWAEDTSDELLTLVGITFHDLVVAVLANPLPDGTPTGDGRPPLAVRAALHARAVADLLSSLALAHLRDTGDEGSPPVDAEAPQRLTAHWIDQIVGLCQDEEDRPAHDTAVDYVRGVAATLSFVARILGAERGLSLDPDDPRGPVERPDEARNSEDAGALLLWCASAAVCIAAKLQPRFKIGSA
jgi:hypothetical protein